MSVKQISIFLPNQQGTLAEVVDLLTKNDIEIHAMVVVDTTDMGILRIVAEDAEKANELLKEAGMISKITEVLIFEPGDEQESLSKLFDLLRDTGVSVEYVYTCFMQEKSLPYMVLKVNDEKKALEVLNERGLRVINL